MSSLFFHRTPWWLQAVYPQFRWRMPASDKVIFLTFDDGPVPEATPMVLDHLRGQNARATFFCVGENIHHNPGIFNRVLEEGHSVGNHTYHHLNGWKSPRGRYLEDVANCQQLIERYDKNPGKPLLRPPYGRIRRTQWQSLIEQYEIVMWNVLSGDYSSSIDADRCLNKTIKYTTGGSIVLFHDSVKTIEKLNIVLPAFLSHFGKLGYSFLPL